MRPSRYFARWLTRSQVLTMLGAMILLAFRFAASTRLSCWFGILSGLMVAGLGCSMLLRRLNGATVVHAHGNGGLHSHWTSFSHDVEEPFEASERQLPIASSALMIALGLLIAGQALAAAHLRLLTLTRGRLGTGLFVAGLGLILGMRHSTDADHVVAIATIVSKQGSIRNAALIGSLWGLGHTITIFIVGSLIILFGVEIPPRVGLSMEFCVALMLMLLGILNLTGVMQKVAARFTPALTSSLSELTRHTPERTNGSRFRGAVERLGVYQCLRPLIIGLVHGLAGSAAVALLVLTTIPNPVWATLYLLIFGAGTMLGMMCMTAAMAVPLTYAGDRYTRLSRYFGVASGMVSLCFGTFLVYQLGYLGGLFTSHPQWTPR